MNIRPFQNTTPQLGNAVYVDESAVVIGDVVLGDDCSVWPQAVIRGDMHRIRIGQRTSIQDGSVLHITHASSFNEAGWPLTIGDDVTIGHRTVLHGCTLGNRILIGNGAIVMDGAIIEDEVIIGANALVKAGAVIPDGSMVIGSPGKVIRETDEQTRQVLLGSAAHYVHEADKMKTKLVEVKR